MQVVIALSADQHIHNLVRRMAFCLVTEFSVNPNCAQPPHISLKQGFQAPALDAIEGYFDRFAANTAPLEVAFDRIYYTEWNDYAIVGLAAVETPALRELHNQLNRELGTLFGNVSAPFDGPDYRFHLTVAMGPASESGYRRYYDSLASHELSLSYTASQAVLFLQLEGICDTTYLDYKLASLGRLAEAQRE